MSEEEKVVWCLEHHRDAKERVEIKRAIAKSIAPLLLSRGFVKSETCFMRVQGDYIFQMITVGNYFGASGLLRYNT